tara:strand:+ start:711 stop:896 length:186 start_codon:yes stop_codon:yes gene_type:complete
MVEVELFGYSWNSAGLAIKHPKKLSTKEAGLMLGEPEKSLSVGGPILYRSVTKTLDLWELV